MVGMDTSQPRGEGDCGSLQEKLDSPGPGQWLHCTWEAVGLHRCTKAVPPASSRVVQVPVARGRLDQGLK